MSFQPEPLVSAVVDALRTKGFRQTASQIEAALNEAALELSAGQVFPESLQREFAASIIECNIVMPYLAWEETVRLIAGVSDVSLDESGADELLLVKGDQALAPLGSFAYRAVIDRLSEITRSLRGGPPLSPRGGGGGGPSGGPDTGGGPFMHATTRLTYSADGHMPLWTGVTSTQDDPFFLSVTEDDEKKEEHTIRIKI